MATVTLQPTAYYQLEGVATWNGAAWKYNNLHVTEVNPAQRKVYIVSDGGAVYCALVHFKIDLNDTYSYSTVSSISLPALSPTPAASSSRRIDVDIANLSTDALNVGDYYEDYFINRSSGAVSYTPQPTSNVLSAQYSNISMSNDDLWLYIRPFDFTNVYSFTNSMPVTITYNAITPSMSILPSGGYLTANSSNTFNIVDSLPNVNRFKKYTALTGTFYYKEGTSAYSSKAITNGVVTLPSGTLSAQAEYTAYASFTTEDGSTGNTSEYTYTTEDAAAVVSIIAPTNTIEYGTVNFSWNYSNTYGSSQYAYDLALSDDNTTFNTVISHEVTAETSTTYTVNTAGAKYWKVRAYNLDDVVGDWSDVGYFVNNIPPEAPTITDISGAGRLTVTWSSTSQIAYEVEVYQGDNKIYDSGEQYTTAKTHLINEYLPNGTYTIKVKILDSFGNSSDYAEQVYTIDNVGSLNVTYTANDTVTLNYDVTGVSKAYILRNGEIIAQTTSGVFNDIYANGTNVYTVITVNADDSYSIGIVETENLVTYTRLVDLEGNIYDISHRFNERIGITRTDQADFDSALFLGSIKPVHTFSKGRVRRYNVTFAYSGDYTEFMAKVVRFMDVYGHSDYVVIPNVSANYRYYGNELSASLEVTDYNAGITYAI